MLRSFSCSALVVAVSLSAADAQAQFLPGYNAGYYPFNRSIYTDQDRIPYFALHPPVYYSRPVARTYGYSPMAYPGWVQTPDVNPVEPAMMINPYFESLPAEIMPGGQVLPEGTTPQLAPPENKTPNPKTPTKQKPVPGKRTSTGDKAAQNVEPLRIVNPYAQGYAVGR